MSTEVRARIRFAAPPERVWRALTNPSVVASCLPGGELVETLGPDAFRGALGVPLGPFRVRFEGVGRFVELDPDAGRAVLVAEATETRGRATAAMRMRSRLEPAGPGTQVEIRQQLELHGSLGRFVPGAVLAEAARYALGRFEESLRRVLAGASAGG